ncbi:MAG TPA: aspartate carbamoyltransferase, partial [Phycicoccus elongatus]|nr:aspartate carbamoyltransferase [Phycicoccus elongatus]
GARVRLVAPATLLPVGIADWPVETGFDFNAAVAERPDVLMMLRVQGERMNDAFFPGEREYSREWGLTDERLARLPAGTIVMHPGPMNRGLEISADAADAAQSLILDQVAAGVAVRMSVLYHLLAGVEGGAA